MKEILMTEVFSLVAKYASTIFNLSCTVYRVVGFIDALGWKSKALSMIYLKMEVLGLTIKDTWSATICKDNQQYWDCNSEKRRMDWARH
jgi:hypothetical protein